MKNFVTLFISIVFLILMCCHVIGQTEDFQARPSEFEVGLVLGYGKANLYDCTMYCTEFNQIPAGIAGAMFQWHFTNRLSMKTGLTYERKGSELNIESPYKYNPYSPKATGSIKLDYLTLPLQSQMEIGNRFRFYLNVGGYCSFLLNNNIQINNRPSAFEQIEVNGDSAHEDQKFDFGVSAEAGFKFVILRKFSSSIGITDHWGLMNSKKLPEIMNQFGEALSSNIDSKNNAYYLIASFSYLINSFKK